jgi:DNA-binding XRE family transcriptional regulator
LTVDSVCAKNTLSKLEIRRLEIVLADGPGDFECRLSKGEKIMGKMKATINSEILRLVKREVRNAFFPIGRKVRAMELKLSGLSKSLAFLGRAAKERIRTEEREKLRLEATSEGKASRFIPGRIRNLRKRLGISQRELALLTGVSRWAVVMWEKGKFKPSRDNKAALGALGKLSKPSAKRMITAKARGKGNAKAGKSKGKKAKGERRFKK